MASDDSKRRGKGRRSDIPWNEIRAAYHDGETNISTLAKRFGVKRDTIAKRRDTDNWASKGQLAQAAHAKVIDITTRKAVEKLGGEAALERQADAIASTLLRINNLESMAADLIERTMKRALGIEAENEPQSRLILGVTQGETTAVNDILGAVSKLSRDLRLHAGLKEGTATSEAGKADDDEKERVDQAILVVRERKQEIA